MTTTDFTGGKLMHDSKVENGTHQLSFILGLVNININGA